MGIPLSNKELYYCRSNNRHVEQKTNFDDFFSIRATNSAFKISSLERVVFLNGVTLYLDLIKLPLISFLLVTYAKKVTAP